MNRTECPVCGYVCSAANWELDFIVPDGWELPTHNVIRYCPHCGMIWYDNDKTQADYDAYYQNRYGYDGALNKGDCFKRQDELVSMANKGAEKDWRIVDFGGGHERYIEKQLQLLGFTDVTTVDAGDELPQDIDMLIASEVLEHIYDLRGTMLKITRAMKLDCVIIVELPDAERMLSVKDQMLLDYHQKHVNHFMPNVLDKLFADYGFIPHFSDRKKEPYHFGYIYLVAYVKDHSAWVYEKSWKTVDEAVDAKVDKLKDITYPVIVWGCSDTCLHLLTKVKLNILHFVDLDPAYKGATIGGIPVLDHVESDAPIVVMAYNQRTAILKSIEDGGLENKVIVI